MCITFVTSKKNKHNNMALAEINFSFFLKIPTSWIDGYVGDWSKDISQAGKEKVLCKLKIKYRFIWCFRMSHLSLCLIVGVQFVRNLVIKYHERMWFEWVLTMKTLCVFVSSKNAHKARPIKFHLQRKMSSERLLDFLSPAKTCLCT